MLLISTEIGRSRPSTSHHLDSYRIYPDSSRQAHSAAHASFYYQSNSCMRPHSMRKRHIRLKKLIPRKIPPFQLHSHSKFDKPQLGKKLRCTLPARAQHPGDGLLLTHDVLDKHLANTLPPERLGHHHHRQVAVRDAIGNGTRKADDLLRLNDHGGALRGRNQPRQVLGSAQPLACSS